MSRTYTYDPGNTMEYGVDRMRFELGDTTFAPGELTAALCNEEYQSIISTTKNWRKAKLQCLEAILMRFSHQVDFSVEGLSYSFSQRVEHWKQLKDELKKSAIVSVPTANPASLCGGNGGEPYFHKDMHKNIGNCIPHGWPRG